MAQAGLIFQIFNSWDHLGTRGFRTLPTGTREVRGRGGGMGAVGMKSSFPVSGGTAISSRGWQVWDVSLAFSDTQIFPRVAAMGLGEIS